MPCQVIRIMYFTILDVFPLVKRIFAINEVDTLSTSMWHVVREESFYLKIVPAPCADVRVLNSCLRQYFPAS